MPPIGSLRGPPAGCAPCFPKRYWVRRRCRDRRKRAPSRGPSGAGRRRWSRSRTGRRYPRRDWSQTGCARCMHRLARRTEYGTDSGRTSRPARRSARDPRRCQTTAFRRCPRRQCTPCCRAGRPPPGHPDHRDSTAGDPPQDRIGPARRHRCRSTAYRRCHRIARGY